MKKTIFIIVALMMCSTINAQLSCNEIRDVLQESGTAQTFNNNLPSNTIDEQDLKYINQININRHTALPAKYMMTNAEDQALFAIAIKDTPVSGYAASLHRYLTGSSFRTLQYRDHRNNSSGRNHQTELNDEISIFPNPLDISSKSLKVEKSLPKEIDIKSISLFSLDGSKSFSNLKLNNNTIDLPYLNQGMYIVQFHLSDGRRISKSLIIN